MLRKLVVVVEMRMMKSKSTKPLKPLCWINNVFFLFNSFLELQEVKCVGL